MKRCHLICFQCKETLKGQLKSNLLQVSTLWEVMRQWSHMRYAWELTSPVWMTSWTEWVRGNCLQSENKIFFISGEFDHVDYNGKQTKCRSACEDQVWHEIFRKLWSRNFYICCQVNSLFVTTSSYPNRKTLIYREEFCIITKRLIKKCRSYKRKPLDREYPHLCNLIQPLEFIE